MKNHLKRIAAPKAWDIDRRKGKFVIRPGAGTHALKKGLPLGLIIRDILKLASSLGEVRKILNNQKVLVDGQQRKDPHFVLGLFDVLVFPQLQKSYRLSINRKGQLTVVEIPAGEADFKVCKVVGKVALPGGKIQLNLHDGKNIINEQKVKVGDSLVLSLPKLELKEVLPLKGGAIVFLTSGKHSGDIGQLKEIKMGEAVYLSEEKEVYTSKAYLFVIGSKNSLLSLQRGELSPRLS